MDMKMMQPVKSLLQQSNKILQLSRKTDLR